MQPLQYVELFGLILKTYRYCRDNQNYDALHGLLEFIDSTLGEARNKETTNEQT